MYNSLPPLSLSFSLYICMYICILVQWLSSIRNGHGDPSSNPGRGCLHFILCWYHWERYALTILPSAWDKNVEPTRFFNLGMTTDLEKGKFWIKFVIHTHFKWWAKILKILTLVWHSTAKLSFPATYRILWTPISASRPSLTSYFQIVRINH